MVGLELCLKFNAVRLWEVFFFLGTSWYELHIVTVALFQDGNEEKPRYGLLSLLWPSSRFFFLLSTLPFLLTTSFLHSTSFLHITVTIPGGRSAE